MRIKYILISKRAKNKRIQLFFVYSPRLLVLNIEKLNRPRIITVDKIQSIKKLI